MRLFVQFPKIHERIYASSTTEHRRSHSKSALKNATVLVLVFAHVRLIRAQIRQTLEQCRFTDAIMLLLTIWALGRGQRTGLAPCTVYPRFWLCQGLTSGANHHQFAQLDQVRTSHFPILELQHERRSLSSLFSFHLFKRFDIMYNLR